MAAERVHGARLLYHLTKKKLWKDKMIQEPRERSWTRRAEPITLLRTDGLRVTIGRAHLEGGKRRMVMYGRRRIS